MGAQAGPLPLSPLPPLLPLQRPLDVHNPLLAMTLRRWMRNHGKVRRRWPPAVRCRALHLRCLLARNSPPGHFTPPAALWQTVKPKLTEEQAANLKMCFSMMDADGSGAIDADELSAAFKVRRAGRGCQRAAGPVQEA